MLGIHAVFEKDVGKMSVSKNMGTLPIVDVLLLGLRLPPANGHGSKACAPSEHTKID